jgi:hypothetical protein
MTIALQKELKRLKAQVAARTAGDRFVRRVIIEAGDETPEEGEGEMLICRVIIDPPERPEEELPVFVAPSPRTVNGTRMAADTNPSFRRHLEYQKDGSIA